MKTTLRKHIINARFEEVSSIYGVGLNLPSIEKKTLKTYESKILYFFHEFFMSAITTSTNLQKHRFKKHFLCFFKTLKCSQHF